MFAVEIYAAAGSLFSLKETVGEKRRGFRA
jgi:hypothetical protein